MKLYYAPAYCSQAVHIALREAGVAPQLVQVDTVAGRAADGEDYAAINPRGMRLAAWPNVTDWLARVRARPQVQQALRAENLLKA